MLQRRHLPVEDFINFTQNCCIPWNRWLRPIYFPHSVFELTHVVLGALSGWIMQQLVMTIDQLNLILTVMDIFLEHGYSRLSWSVFKPKYRICRIRKFTRYSVWVITNNIISLTSHCRVPFFYDIQYQVDGVSTQVSRLQRWNSCLGFLWETNTIEKNE
jgi:hypothetical protein